MFFFFLLQPLGYREAGENRLNRNHCPPHCAGEQSVAMVPTGLGSVSELYRVIDRGTGFVWGLAKLTSSITTGRGKLFN